MQRQTHTRTRARTHTHAHTHTHTHARTHARMHTQARTHTQTHVHVRMHAHTHKRTRTYTRTHTSFCTVSFTLILFECGSVQTNPASTRCTLLSPLSFFRHRLRSSRDSNTHDTHAEGGCKYLCTRTHTHTPLSPLCPFTYVINADEFMPLQS